MKKLSSDASPQRRRGFTLIEMLAVIAILSILMVFLIPAVQNSRRAAKVVQVKSDINTLNSAINSFKQDFGVEPPSSITLCENASDWNTYPASKAIISRLWPQFDFTIAHRDINNDGDPSGAVHIFNLSGSECLVFFLGGVVDSNAVPNGFSRNPANPFDLTSTSRTRYLTFTSDRLISSTSNTNFYGYNDPLTGTPKPYLYVTSYEGQGYNAADFGTLQETIGGSLQPLTASVYMSSSTQAWNPNGYQIISAGFDRRYGGPSPNGTASSPYPFGGLYQKGSQLPVNRDSERDNITNFSDGLLVP